uniref:Uncharacterized protein n=1 Tax=Candidatus Nitrotoga fabula TaxID=2182327 RepID=A0A2X0QV16_9PROT|nr:protein of unknown function [Candidatus Nitrotoga fabula]
MRTNPFNALTDCEDATNSNRPGST